MFYEIIGILEAFSKTCLKLGFASPSIGDDPRIIFNRFFACSGFMDDLCLHSHLLNKTSSQMIKTLFLTLAAAGLHQKAEKGYGQFVQKHL